MDNIDNVDNLYVISRQEAGKTLDVSVRTIDRYIRQGRLSTRVRKGRIWLNKDELANFYKTGKTPRQIDNVNRIDKVDSFRSKTQVIDGNSSDLGAPLSTLNKHITIYRELYEQLRLEAKSQQERLEAANYRVGQLETRLETSIPLLDITRERHSNVQQNIKLHENLNSCQSELREVTIKNETEKANKKLYLAVLICILISQPLWIWLSILD